MSLATEEKLSFALAGAIPRPYRSPCKEIYLHPATPIVRLALIRGRRLNGVGLDGWTPARGTLWGPRSLLGRGICCFRASVSNFCQVQGAMTGDKFGTALTGRDEQSTRNGNTFRPHSA